MIDTRLRFLVFDPDPRGNPRYYARKRVGDKLRKVRIRAPFDSDPNSAFMAAYAAALTQLDGQGAAVKPTPREDSFGWLWDEYQRSPLWKSFDRGTQADKRGVIGKWIASIEQLPFRKYRRQDVLASQAKRADRPSAADKLVKYLKAWFAWAVKEGHMTTNPAGSVDRIAPKAAGAKPWTAAEIEKYRQRHSLGTQARLALELMLQVGARISDAAQLGRQHEFDDPEDGNRWLGFTAHKNRNRHRVTIEQPMLPELIEALRACNQVGDLTYLVTEAGAAFTIKGLGNKMRDWCDAAGLQHLSAHGLRKAAATTHAENGASAHELMTWFGWTKLETAEIYTRAAEKRRMARRLVRLSEHRKNESVSLPGPKSGDETKKGKTL